MRAAYSFVPMLMLSFLLSACGGGGGGGGDGAALAALAALGTAGTITSPATTSTEPPGTSTGIITISSKTLVTVSTEAPGVHCANGGMRIEAGLDSDDNGVLAAGEVGSTQYVCRGAAGVPSTLVQTRDEPGGANCAASGKAISVGVDGNANGLLEAAEITGTGYVCNSADGSRVASAPNMLVSIASEAAGANCAYGGNKVTTGPDSNANGRLDADEVSATSYICNCAASGWVDVTGAAVQAQSNMCYIARDDAAQVVLTLPANPAIGDLVRIKGVGLSGWKIAQNAGQAVYTQSLGGMAGADWTAHGPSETWYSVASSADGSKLVAVPDDGYIYTSTDAGATWTARGPNQFWSGVASSADGNKLVAVAYGGKIYTSTDAGVTWIARASDQNWYSVASSADGSKLVAVVYGGYIYTSSDSGENWIARASIQNWETASASSADGSKLVAVVSGRQIYTSSDSGESWTPRDTARSWVALASSADGNKLVAVVYGGQIYTSTDAGVTWTAHESNRDWQTVASSADGSKLVAGVRGSGQIYTSTDSGVTWTARDSNRNWWTVASSADGSRLVAMVYGGQIYTSIAATTLGTGGSISGAASDTIELQYVGNGMFTVLGHEGSLSIQ